MSGISLLPLFKRATELFVEQGIFLPKTESDAEMLMGQYKGRNCDDGITIVVKSPTEVFARASYGYTSSLEILPEEGPFEVRALGLICAAVLRRHAP